jgi:hypothetical protein
MLDDWIEEFDNMLNGGFGVSDPRSYPSAPDELERNPMAMITEWITDTGLNYDNAATCERRCQELNNQRIGDLFAKHFVRQIRFDRDGAFHTVVCVNRKRAA